MFWKNEKKILYAFSGAKNWERFESPMTFVIDMEIETR